MFTLCEGGFTNKRFGWLGALTSFHKWSNPRLREVPQCVCIPVGLVFTHFTAPNWENCVRGVEGAEGLTECTAKSDRHCQPAPTRRTLLRATCNIS